MTRGDLLTLEDGSLVRLAGIVLPGPTSGYQDARPLAEQARAVLDALAGGRKIEVEASGTDRHGRKLALVTEPGGAVLQEALVRLGLAWAWPEGLPEGAFKPLLAAEAEARTAGLGLWGVPALAPEEAEGVRPGAARFALVEGRVLETARQQRYVYLNFGADWRSDFSARVPLGDARRMTRAGFDPLQLGGRLVRVRGWLFAAGGPMVEVTEREQIEELA